MRTILDSRKHRREIRVAVFLIAVILLAGMAGCNRDSGMYTLTIASTAGGSVRTPGEGTFSYGNGTVVELLAVPDDGYKFQAWTGDTDGVTDPASASTNITISGDCSIMASFEEEGGPSPVNPLQ